MNYLQIARTHLETILDSGLDRYGRIHTPYWMSILDVETLDSPRRPQPLDEARRVDRRGRRAPAGCNLALDQAMIRAAHAVSRLFGDSRFAQAADAYVAHYCRHAVDSQTGLFEWGWHNYYDAYEDAVRYLEGHHHEIHAWMPAWPQLHVAAPGPVEQEIRSIWEWHVDHETGQIGRHPDRGLGCSFAMTAGEFVAAFAFLSSVRNDGSGNSDRTPLQWALKVARRHWDARNPRTNLFPNRVGETEDRFDCRNADTSISGLWCSRLLMAYAWTRCEEFLDMAVRTLRAFARYGWDDASGLPWGVLELDGTPVPGPRSSEGYDQWTPRGHLDLWPAYVLGYEFPHKTALCYALAHSLTGDRELLHTACRWSDVFQHSLSSLPEGTYAEHYGQVVSLDVALWRATGDHAHLERAQASADDALRRLWTGRILRGHGAKPYYEAVDGVGFLTQGLVELGEAEAERERGGVVSSKAAPDWNF